MKFLSEDDRPISARVIDSNNYKDMTESEVLQLDMATFGMEACETILLSENTLSRKEEEETRLKYLTYCSKVERLLNEKS